MFTGLGAGRFAKPQNCDVTPRDAT